MEMYLYVRFREWSIIATALQTLEVINLKEQSMES